MSTIEIIKGDITQVKAAAIVNAANTSLLGGGGVDGAIHKAGGNEILEECRKIRNRQGGCKVGEAVITTGGKLPSKYVIHTVGPTWVAGANNEQQKLENCYTNSLSLAVEHHIISLAFPAISTGIYRFPKPLAAEIALKSVQHFLKANTVLQKVYFVCFDQENYDCYTKLLGE